MIVDTARKVRALHWDLCFDLSYKQSVPTPARVRGFYIPITGSLRRLCSCLWERRRRSRGSWRGI